MSAVIKWSGETGKVPPKGQKKKTAFTQEVANAS